MNPDEKVEVSIPVRAGEVLGVARVRPGQCCLDWGVVDYGVTLGFIHPETYPPSMAHAVCPLDYLREDLRERAYQKVRRVDEPRGGKIDYDLPGRLSGNWFLEGGEPGVWNWSRHLAFVYHTFNASQPVVSVGGNALSPLPTGLYNASGPDPASVTVESGVVTYYLTYVAGEAEPEDVNFTLIVQGGV